MIRLQISDEEVKTLEQERFHDPHPRVQRKIEAVYLTAMGVSRPEVARLLQVSEGTVRTYVKAYGTGGLAALRVFNPHPKTAALDAHAATLREAFAVNPPHTVQEAVDRIEAVTGIRRSPTQVREWLKKPGLAVAKPVKSRPKLTRSRNSYSWIPN